MTTTHSRTYLATRTTARVIVRLALAGVTILAIQWALIMLWALS